MGGRKSESIIKESSRGRYKEQYFFILTAYIKSASRKMISPVKFYHVFMAQGGCDASRSCLNSRFLPSVVVIILPAFLGRNVLSLYPPPLEPVDGATYPRFLA